MQRITDDEWLKLQLAIEEKSLVLVIGPGVSTIETEKGPKLMTLELRDTILAGIPENQRPPDDSDLSTTAEVFQRAKSRMDLEIAVKNFFKKQWPVNDRQKNLARLPFSFIINAAPDQQICRALELANIEYREGIYDHQETRAVTFNAGDPWPFVYHLFGAVSFKNPMTNTQEGTVSSLVLTGSEQLQFLKKITDKEWRIPTPILSYLRAAKTFLFVGFDFENWYLRILLNSLGLATDNPRPPIGLHSGDGKLGYGPSVFFGSSYRMQFLGLELDDFVRDLRQRHDAAAPSDSGNGRKNVVRALILASEADEKIKQAFMLACAPLRQLYGLQFLEIEAGDETSTVLGEHLAASQFVFPLITANFWGEEWLYDFFTESVKKAEIEGRRIVSPIICGHCQWKTFVGQALLKNALPSDGQPISASADAHRAWTEVAEAIERRIQTHFLT